VNSQAEQVMGHGHEPHLPVLTCLLVFILCLNLFGLLPGIDTPSSNPVVPLGLAVFTFLYYNWKGVRAQGPIGYVKHFMGPAWWIAPLMFPIEIISHLARMLSLTVRLFANMLASDLITLIFFSMVPPILPLIGLGLHSFVAIIQAYIFMLLATIYVGEATAHAEQH
jgi:F-type H+-transporting ATPase subunit a